MAKIIFFIGFLCLSFLSFGQKPAFFLNKAYNLNSFSYFFIEDAAFPIEKIQDPFTDKKNLNDNEFMDYALHNELSLKNLTGTDDEHGSGVLLCYIYIKNSFLSEGFVFPHGYKAKKLKTDYLIIDLFDASTHTLVWRGWIDQKKLPGTTTNERLQKGIALLMTLYTGAPADPVYE